MSFIGLALNIWVDTFGAGGHVAGLLDAQAVLVYDAQNQLIYDAQNE